MNECFIFILSLQKRIFTHRRNLNRYEDLLIEFFQDVEGFSSLSDLFYRGSAAVEAVMKRPQVSVNTSVSASVRFRLIWALKKDYH